MKAFTLHPVYDDVPLCAYIEHVRMTRKHNVLCSVTESAVLVRIPYFLNRLHVRNAFG